MGLTPLRGAISSGGGWAQIADAFAAYRELGVHDLSVVLGHDDASAMRTLEVLLGEVLPALRR